MANALKFQWSPDEAIEKLYKHGLFDNSNRGFLLWLMQWLRCLRPCNSMPKD